MGKPAELLQGTLDLLILRTLSLQPLHGVGVADRLKQITTGVFDVKPGSLFPALHRLEAKGWIEGDWGATEGGRRARFYTLTAEGRKQLSNETREWRRISGAVERVLLAE
ncbi:MAG: PadR family transcriptional regulator [Bryobacteraceae bacterium]|nr:PadR family transcriptional regulator [Bryobacteraceae bacterium]